jgi:DNA sulfur modification protein DndB
VLAYSHPIWQKRFEKRFTRPGDEQLPGTWKNRLAWIKQLNETRNRVFHAQGIGEDDQAFLIELRDWLLRGEIENDL